MHQFVIFVMILVGQTAMASNILWKGTYRAEWMQIDRPSLGDPPSSKAYGLNYLSLNPHIIASDGVNIYGSFDIMSNGTAAYTDSRSGQIWGAPSSMASKVLSETKAPSAIQIRELYLNVEEENGSLIVGRAPLEFGLGIFQNAGRESFDHWATISDVVGYKFIVGNMFFMPMIGRVSATDFGLANVVQDERFHIQYESEETGSMIGVLMNRRRSSEGSNDAPTTALAGTKIGGFNMNTTGVVLGRSWENFKFKMEAAFMTGNYGLANPSGESILNNSYGVAVEMDFLRPQSKWDWSLRMGTASGDNPNTKDFEGFFFHRNYDIAMLMFNHRLGRADFLRTNLIKDTALDLSNSIDDETISNVMYLSPRFKYEWKERWDLVNTVTYAQLVQNPTNSLDFSKDLGLEWDIELVYKPRKNVRWINQLGLLFPGGAFKDGATNHPTSFTHGFSTKAAISF